MIGRLARGVMFQCQLAWAWQKGAILGLAIIAIVALALVWWQYRTWPKGEK